MMVYGLCADLHLHSWGAFSGTDERGVNTRLTILLDEVERCAKETRAAGGDYVFVAGDLFHVRGSVAPAVLNPTKHRLREIAQTHKVAIVILPGNHDMQFRSTSEVGNAIEAVSVDGKVCVVHRLSKWQLGDDNTVFLVPWTENLEELKKYLADVPEYERGRLDVIMHAPIDGVIEGLPLHGLDPNWLAGLGFRRVFSGHYHNHKVFNDGKVVSIGAIAHHTWSDVGSTAGFLIVKDDAVQRFDSHAPKFVDIFADDDEVETALRVQGNYVRAKTASTKTAELNELRDWLEKCGARGVLIQHVPDAAVTRTAETAKAATARTLEESVAGFVEAIITDPERAKQVTLECQKILAEASVV